jgi:Fibronectin type III domain
MRGCWTGTWQACTVLSVIALCLASVATLGLAAPHIPAGVSPLIPEAIGVHNSSANNPNIEFCDGRTYCDSKLVSTANDSLVLIAVSDYETAGAATVQLNGEPSAVATLVETTSTQPVTQIWAVPITIGGGSYRPWVNFTVKSYYEVSMVDLNGSLITTPYISGESTATGTGTATSCSMTTSVAGEEAFTVVSAFASETNITPTAPQTQLTFNHTGTVSNVVSQETQLASLSSSGVVASAATLDSTSAKWGTACIGLLPASAPSAPTGLAAQKILDTTVVLSWTDAPAQERYIQQAHLEQASYSAGTCGSFHLVPGVNNTNDGPETATPANLSSGRAYCWEVSVANGTGFSSWSSPVTDVVTSTIPNAPTDVRAYPAGLEGPRDYGQSAINLTWHLLGFNLTDSNVYVYSAGCHSLLDNDSLGSPANFTQVGSLLHGTTYCFTVTTTSNTGQGQPSTPSSSSIATTLPNAPNAVAAVLTGATTVTVAWQAPAGENLSGADVEIYAGASCGGLPIEILNDGPTASSMVIPTLSPLTSYSFDVSMATAGNAGPNGNCSAAKTGRLAPTAPSDVTVTEITGATALVSWKTGSFGDGSRVLRNVVLLGPAGGEWTLEYNASTFATSLEVVGLENATTYSVEVVMDNSSGGVASSAATFTTGTASTPLPAPTATDYTFYLLLGAVAVLVVVGALIARRPHSGG